MKKCERIEELISIPQGVIGENISYHPCYVNWFTYFNNSEFYTAHDVLEHLWLKTHDDNRTFFKGLIQLAGAFVHLKKQFERPWHPKDGRRMYPAVRLFTLASTNLEPYGPHHLRLNISAISSLCAACTEEIKRSDYLTNPWSPERTPQIFLANEGSPESQTLTNPLKNQDSIR